MIYSRRLNKTLVKDSNLSFSIPLETMFQIAIPFSKQMTQIIWFQFYVSQTNPVSYCQNVHWQHLILGTLGCPSPNLPILYCRY